jgi:hypothetical protein
MSLSTQQRPSYRASGSWIIGTDVRYIAVALGTGPKRPLLNSPGIAALLGIVRKDRA